MELCIAGRAPLDRWACVEALGVDPSRAMDLDTALARLLHPTSSIDELVLLVRDELDVAWLRRFRAATAHRQLRPTVAAIAAESVQVGDVARAGADAVVTWDTRGPLPGGTVLVALGRASDLVVVVPERAPAMS